MMRYTEPNEPVAPEAAEEKLREENRDLRRQIQELRGSSEHSSHSGVPIKIWHPSGITIAVILLGLVAIMVVAFFAGYLPRERQIAQITSESHEQAQALPRVEVIEVGRGALKSGLQLSGAIQAITEAPVLARADGYLARRLVDIGDRVKTGQPLAEIEAPELDSQVNQSKANVRQTEAALDQALANLDQGKADMELARVTAERWRALVAKGVVSKQENDQYQAQYQSKAATVQALEKAIAAQRGSVASAQANVARLEQVQSYRIVRAPFDGVITLRNVDAGALVSGGSTLLFRIAQIDTLRGFVNVPQIHASSIRPGQVARLTVSNLPGRQFTGVVARSASSLDPASRTLLVELNVPNADHALLPGMYAQVDLSDARSVAPLLIPSDALIVRSDGAQVAIVRPDHSIHLQKIAVARDYGDRLEVASGLREGETIIANPGDEAHEGTKVDPVPLADKASPPTSKK